MKNKENVLKYFKSFVISAKTLSFLCQAPIFHLSLLQLFPDSITPAFRILLITWPLYSLLGAGSNLEMSQHNRKLFAGMGKLHQIKQTHLKTFQFVPCYG